MEVFKLANITPFDYLETKEYDEDIYESPSHSETPEIAASKAMDNFAPKEANHAISIRLIPIVSFFNQWEKRNREWVGIPQGTTVPLLPKKYFTFFSDMFDQAITYSASRNGKGREQIMEVLKSYFSHGASDFGFKEIIKEKFAGDNKK